jgi:hypothetical protein
MSDEMRTQKKDAEEFSAAMMVIDKKSQNHL